MQQRIESIARALHLAEEQRVPLPPLSETYEELTAEQAYAIQSAWLDIKRRERPVRLVGHKIGLTSLAMQQLLGIDQPDYGFLLDSMMTAPGSAVRRADFIAPRIEPEIAFWLSSDLRGPGVTIENVLAATRGVSAALELVDSRIRDWRIKLVDTIADNASSARVIVSERIVDPAEIDLVAESVTLLRNDERVGTGTGAAVLNHPASAVAWLANRLADFGVALRAGQLILPGAMCSAVNVDAGATYRANFAHLGEVAIHFI
jgi:2-keto-4-pentenoate hydratase